MTAKIVFTAAGSRGLSTVPTNARSRHQQAIKLTKHARWARPLPDARSDGSLHNVEPVTEDILGYGIVSEALSQCLDELESWVMTGDRPRSLACLNPHSDIIALADRDFSTALHSADWLVPDGVGIVLASHILGGDIHDRITGSDIFQGLNRHLDAVGGCSCFFLGSTADTLRQITARMARDYPNIRVAGVYSPPFKAEFTAEDDAAMIAAVNAARPDVLWVGMTAPKQEKWVYHHKNRLAVKFIAAIGAAFDFYAGTVQRSPILFQKLGLEWLHRLLHEPRRLWRRNFISNPKFMARVLRARLTH